MKKILIITTISLSLYMCFLAACKKEDKDNTTQIDNDGNLFKSVTIGTQIWMAENLKTTKYQNSDLIATTTIDISSEDAPKYQWAYGGDENNVPIYGRLYTWYAISDSRNVCPKSWHIPTDAEWTTLTTYLGGQDVAGGKLKEAGLTHWQTPNSDATNESGFTALPNGYHGSVYLNVNGSWTYSYLGSFLNIGSFGMWWSSTGHEVGNAWRRGMKYNTKDVTRDYWDKSYGFSVRCIKD